MGLSQRKVSTPKIDGIYNGFLHLQGCSQHPDTSRRKITFEAIIYLTAMEQSKQYFPSCVFMFTHVHPIN